MRQFTILSICVCLMLPVIAGCSETVITIQNPVVIDKQPDIRIIDFDSGAGFNISLGAYANATFTLYNYGDAAGQVTIAILGDYSGVVAQINVIVPARQTVIKTVEKIDMSANDSRISAKILSQSKIQ